METAYQVLGISPGASEQEIKKAYFRLVRTNSPETNPEQFQKIRAAYEQLKNGGGERRGPEFPPMEDPWAAKLYRHITELAARGDWEWCKEACEQGCRKFPQYSQFLYSLIHAQILCGNTGKAVKSAERLAATEPDNPWFQKELAGAYLSRGYMKKALSAFERTVELGCTDTECMLGYSKACGGCGQYNRGIRILFDIVNQDKKWPKERLKEPVDAYYGLLELNHNGPQTYFGEILDHLGSFLKQYRVSLSEYVLDLAEQLSEYFVEDRENVRKAEQTFELLKSCCRDRDLKEDIDQEAGWLMEQRLSRDERLGEALKSACEVYALLENEEASQLRRFAYADVQLCMLEEHLEVLDQAKILQEEYPDYYAMLEDFLKKLRSEGDLGRLKEQLLKDYRRMEPNFDGGKYFEKYPEERNRGQGRLVSAGDREEPYVRSEKKVGRNDPCPCGSGKKYKHCCMNK